MQIEDRISPFGPVLNGDSARPAESIKEDTLRKPLAGEQAIKVDISPTAAEKADDEARIERLNAVRRQLAEGTYNISGKDVAEKILKVLKN